MCQKVSIWQNQPLIAHMPVLNLLLSAAILIAGCGIQKTFRMLSFLKVSKSPYKHSGLEYNKKL